MSELAQACWTQLGVSDAELGLQVSSEIVAAVVGIREDFPGHCVHAWLNGSGGAYVVIDQVDIGDRWSTQTTWLGFHINYTYPEGDVYPHFLRADLQRAEQGALAAPFNASGEFAGQPATVLSRASHQRDLETFTASRKARSVISFLRDEA
jgi:hypothetical protein